MKIALAQLNFTVGALVANTDKIIKVIEDYGHLVDLIVFSELAVSGYPPLDLVENPDFIEEHDKCVRLIMEKTKGVKAKVALGVISSGSRLRNALMVIGNNSEVYWQAKQLLPTYDIFDEARHFVPGEFSEPISINGVKVGFLICEDCWNDKCDVKRYKVNPVEDMVSKGAQMIISLNASPSDVVKQYNRERMFSEIAKDRGVQIVYVNQVGANDDIVFDGNSFVMNKDGQIVCGCPGFEEAVVVYDSDHDVSPIKHEYPFKHEVIHRHLVMGLRDYVRKCGFERVVIGCSGGIDSAVVTAIAAEALGPENVTAITMPSEYSSDGSVSDSVALCQNLGVELKTFRINQTFNAISYDFRQSIEAKGEPAAMGLEWENAQARIRGMVLMAYSNRYGVLVLSTGNKSEMSVGYCTLYGDMCGGLSLIADLYKTEVYNLAKYINNRAGREIVPQNILNKEPSAELAPGQKDTDSLPPYPVLDRILKLYIEGNNLHPDTIELYKADLVGMLGSEQAVNETYLKVIKMVDRAEFKRRQAPPTIRCHGKAFGAGRRLPIAQKFAVKKPLFE